MSHIQTPRNALEKLSYEKEVKITVVYYILYIVNKLYIHHLAETLELFDFSITI